MTFLLLCPSGPSYAAPNTPERPDTVAIAAVQGALQPKPVQTLDFDTQVLIPLRKAQAEEAARESARIEAARQAYLRDLTTTANRLGFYAPGNYGWGQCTWYVSTRLPVPNSLGNANEWYAGLKAQGWREGAPRRGAIGVSFAGYYGHVVVVEQANDDGTVIISEMNYNGGVGIVDDRLTSSSDFVYLYP